MAVTNDIGDVKILETTELKFNVTKSKMFKLCNTVCPQLVSGKKMLEFSLTKLNRESFFIFECNSYSFHLFPYAGKVFLTCKRTYDNSEVFNKVVNFDLLKELSFFKVKGT